MDIIKLRILIAVFLILNCCDLSAQLTEERYPKPKLIVGIVVDQMRVDHLYRFWHRYSEDGFKKLMNEGHYCSDTHYNQMPTYTGTGLASIYTGSTSDQHGIIGNVWFDEEDARGMYCVRDKDVLGVGGLASAGRVSPVNLNATTLADELMLATNFRSKVISVSLKDRCSVFGAGHSGTDTYWFDSSTGNFMSSTYYMKSLPSWVRSFNEMRKCDSALAKPWTTLYDIKTYKQSSPDLMSYEGLIGDESEPVFPHILSAGKAYEGIKYSPAGNKILTELAIEAIEVNDLGKDEITDLLAISYSSTDYVGHRYGPNSIEIEDTFLRLDRDIANLLKRLEDELGKENFILFLTADHGVMASPEFLKEHKIPASRFDSRVLEDSLRSFVTRTFGNEKLYDGTHECQVYLNRNLKDQQFDTEMQEIENKVCKYLESYPGIKYAFPAHEIKRMSYTGRTAIQVQNGFYPSRSGNITFVFDQNVVDYWGSTGTTHGTGYNYDTHVPLIFYGFGIKSGETRKRVHIEDIAASISSACRISLPNSSTGRVIDSIFP